MRFALRFTPLRQTEGVLFLLVVLCGPLGPCLIDQTSDPTIRGLECCEDRCAIR